MKNPMDMIFSALSTVKDSVKNSSVLSTTALRQDLSDGSPVSASTTL